MILSQLDADGFGCWLFFLRDRSGEFPVVRLLLVGLLLVDVIRRGFRNWARGFPVIWWLVIVFQRRLLLNPRNRSDRFLLNSCNRSNRARSFPIFGLARIFRRRILVYGNRTRGFPGIRGWFLRVPPTVAWASNALLPGWSFVRPGVIFF